jgi:hypothetical protein
MNPGPPWPLPPSDATADSQGDQYSRSVKNNVFERWDTATPITIR